MDNPLISIIVPIYNVENYLKECVDSLIKQTYSNIEILLIDDGSTDNSGEIANEYINKDKKIKVFHKKNGGLSDARNYGIERAKGKYICFVDSDDYVSDDYVNFLYQNLLSNKVLISSCGYVYVYPNKRISIINFENINKKYDNDEAQKYLNIIGYFNVSSCNKLFAKELFDNIRFPLNKKSEDWFIMCKIINEAKGLYYSSEYKYFYRQRENSITKSSNINYDCIEAAKYVIKYYKENNIKEALPYAYQSLFFAYIGVYNALFFRNNSIKEAKKIRKELLNYKYKTVYSKLSFSRKIQLFLFKHNLLLYSICFNYYDKKRKQ